MYSHIESQLDQHLPVSHHCFLRLSCVPQTEPCHSFVMATATAIATSTSTATATATAIATPVLAQFALLLCEPEPAIGSDLP